MAEFAKACKETQYYVPLMDTNGGSQLSLHMYVYIDII